VRGETSGTPPILSECYTSGVNARFEKPGTTAAARHKPYTQFFILSIVLLACGCRPTIANYRHMKVDPDSLQVSFSDRLSQNASPEPYYFVFHMSDGQIQVTHFAEGTDEKHNTYNFFFVGKDGRLVNRQKREQLLVGLFGTVYADIDYFYSDIYGSQPTTLETALYFNDAGHEAAKNLSALPAEADRLDGVSVVRVFRGGPQYLVATANYGSDGHLESISINGSKDGNWIHSNYVSPADNSFEVGTMMGDRPETRKRFGLPAQFPIQTYQRPNDSVFLQTQYELVLDAVNFHFNRSRWVKQDVVRAGGEVETRFLEFIFTQEDQDLNRIDSRRTFGR
jgi:hypothetical protein